MTNPICPFEMPAIVPMAATRLPVYQSVGDRLGCAWLSGWICLQCNTTVVPVGARLAVDTFLKHPEIDPPGTDYYEWDISKPVRSLRARTEAAT